jgi:heterodisulfide reductase subunit B2
MQIMRYTFFIGCNIPPRVPHYELSARAVSDKLDIELVDIPDFGCCGYPMRNTDFKAYILFSARNIALAETKGLDLLTLCKCCFGSLKKADHLLKEDTLLRDEINAILAKEGLAYNGSLEVKHFLSVLYHDIGMTALKPKITRSFKDLKIATHHGCHALRPSDVMQFDDPVAPVLFDQLVEATGAESVDWPLKLQCCGAPQMGINDALSMDLTQKKIVDAQQAGGDYLCAACPWCQMQFDRVQQMMNPRPGTNHHLPSIIFPQLLGLVMGIDPEALGMDMNEIDIRTVEKYLSGEKNVN